MSAPEIFLTAVAAKTSRIRVGHAAVCMPFGYNHPVRVAERAAMLDIISDGRLNLGAARGGTAQEMSLCGVDPELTTPQVEEALRFIGHCWREDTIQWDSDLLTIQHPPGRPPHTVVPRPVQLPHPPLFLACTNPETVRRAARYGVGPMVLGFGGPEVIGDMRRMFDEERAIARSRRGRVAGDDQRRVRRAVPHVPDGRSRRGVPQGLPRAALLRRGDLALVRTQRRGTDARHRRASTTPRTCTSTSRRPAPPSPAATRRRPRRHRSTTPTTRSVTPTPRSRTSNGCAPPASTT